MNAREVDILAALMTSSDACFDDLRKRGSITPANAASYRKSRFEAETLINAWTPLPHIEPLPHPACVRLEIQESAMFEEPVEVRPE
jgi:hypothetical protein